MNVDVAVLGGGAPAVATAAVAREMGLTVAHLAAGGGETAFAGGALASPFGLFPRRLRDIDGAMLRRLGRWRAPEWRAAAGQGGNLYHFGHRLLAGGEMSAKMRLQFRIALLRQALRLYRGVGDAYGRSLVRETGCFIAIDGDRGDRRPMVREAADAGGIDLAEPSVRAVAPGVQRFGYDTAAGSFIVDPGALAELLKPEGQGERGSDQRGEVRALKRENGGWTIRTSGAPIRANHVVFTSVEALSAFAPAIARRLPLGRYVVASQHFAALHGRFDPLTTARGRFVMLDTPRGVQVRLAPRVLMTAGLAENAFKSLLGGLGNILGEPRDVIHLETVWDTPDGLPIAGEMPDRPGIWLNLGWGEHGAVFGVACAQLVAAWLAGHPVDEVWQPLSARRFALRSISKRWTGRP